MSKAYLSKLRSELAGHDVAYDSADKKVEDIVTEFVKDAFSRLHHNAESNNGNEKEGEVQHDVHTTLHNDKESTYPAVLNKVFSLLNMLMSSLESEKEAAKDREKRLSIQIKILSGQVTDLSAALEAAKAGQEASERRIRKILQDTKSRISSNTVYCKQPHRAVRCRQELL